MAQSEDMRSVYSLLRINYPLIFLHLLVWALKHVELAQEEAKEKILIFPRQMHLLVSWGIEKIPLCISIAGIQSEFQKPQTTGLPSPLLFNSLICSISWYLHQMSFFPHNIFPSPAKILLPHNRVNNYYPLSRLMSSDSWKLLLCSCLFLIWPNYNCLILFIFLPTSVLTNPLHFLFWLLSDLLPISHLSGRASLRAARSGQNKVADNPCFGTASHVQNPLKSMAEPPLDAKGTRSWTCILLFIIPAASSSSLICCHCFFP